MKRYHGLILILSCDVNQLEKEQQEAFKVMWVYDLGHTFGRQHDKLEVAEETDGKLGASQYPSLLLCPPSYDPETDRAQPS